MPYTKTELETVDFYQEFVSKLRTSYLEDLQEFATPTRIYMSGSVRSWVHYIDLRSGHGTQKEHMDIANACKSIFTEQFPTVSEALQWV